MRKPNVAVEDIVSLQTIYLNEFNIYYLSSDFRVLSVLSVLARQMDYGHKV